jgi:hypothetical protein
MNEDLDEQIAQSAKEAMKGVNLLQFGHANTTINDVVRTAINIKNITIQRLSIYSKQHVSVNIIQYGDGNIKIPDIHLNKVFDVISKELNNVKNNIIDTTNLTRKFSQASESTVEGMSMNIFSSIIFAVGFISLGGLYIGGKVVFPITLALSLLTFYQYFNWTDKVVLSENFVNRVIDTDEICGELKELTTIENTKGAEIASYKCLKNKKCTAYNWSHDSKKTTLFEGVVEEECKRRITEDNVIDTPFNKKQLIFVEGNDDPTKKINGNIYINNNRRTIWLNKGQHGYNNWRELKKVEKLIRYEIRKIDPSLKIMAIMYGKYLPDPMPNTLFIEHSDPSNLKFHVYLRRFMTGKELAARDNRRDWAMILNLQVHNNLLDLNDSDSCGIVINKKKTWLLYVSIGLLVIGILGIGLNKK